MKRPFLTDYDLARLRHPSLLGEAANARLASEAKAGQRTHKSVNMWTDRAWNWLVGLLLPGIENQQIPLRVTHE